MLAVEEPYDVYVRVRVCARLCACVCVCLVLNKFIGPKPNVGFYVLLVTASVTTKIIFYYNG